MSNVSQYRIMCPSGTYIISYDNDHLPLMKYHPQDRFRTELTQTQTNTYGGITYFSQSKNRYVVE